MTITPANTVFNLVEGGPRAFEPVRAINPEKNEGGISNFKTQRVFWKYLRPQKVRGQTGSRFLFLCFTLTVAVTGASCQFRQEIVSEILTEAHVGYPRQFDIAQAKVTEMF